MKKLTSIILALVLVLSLSTVAFAAEVSYTPTNATSFTINKTYTSDETFVPGETLSFTIEADTNNPDTSKLISIGTENKYTVTGTSNQITVTVPSFSVAGEYNWTIKEVAGNTAGVTTYDSGKTIYVVALVEYNNETNALQIANLSSFIKKIDGTKTDEFVNVFQTNNFSVAKDVDGNMANENDEFEITVTLTSDKPVLTPITVGGETVEASAWTESDSTHTYTTTLNLSEADGATTFADVPYGVKVTVVENTATDKMNGYAHAGYTVNGEETNTVSFVIDDETENTDVVVVKNEKTSEVDTGIFVDSLPYVMMLAIAAFGLVLFFSKKRMMREN